MREDRYEPAPRTSSKKRRRNDDTQRTSAPSGMVVNDRGIDPVVRVEIYRASGVKKIFIGDQIDGDNPEIRELMYIRSSRRFWRMDYAPEDTLEQSTDEEMLECAKSIPVIWGKIKGIKDPEKQLMAAGQLLHMVPGLCATDENGVEIIQNGHMVPAAKPATPAPAASAAT